MLQKWLSVGSKKEMRCDLFMQSKVAVVEFGENIQEALEHAIELIGKIDDLNKSERSVVIKVGVFNPRAENHTTPSVAGAIVKSFSKVPKIYLVESDNYRGKGIDRLQLWKKLFSDKIVPFSLSEDTRTVKVKIVEEEIRFSHILFKPNVLVSTHILRGYERGSILKNLFGLIPDSKKARFHKNLDKALADIYEAVGGVDLAVLDGTYLYSGFGATPHVGEDCLNYRTRMNVLIVGRDAVAVEAVGASLAGLSPNKMSVIEEFVRRGLGEGDLKNIEILGVPLGKVREKFALDAKLQKKVRVKRGAPKTWGGQAHIAMKGLVQGGFFKFPNKRTREDVTKAFEAKGIPTKDCEDKIKRMLTLRVKRRILNSVKEPNGWVYWTE